MKPGHINQSKDNRDAVRAGTLLADLYARLERIYRRHGLPGLAIWTHNLEQDLADEYADLDGRIAATDGTMRLLLAFRLLNDGHAKTLGEAADLADDLERVRELYPEAFKR
jgi:hypothetical protein